MPTPTPTPTLTLTPTLTPTTKPTPVFVYNITIFYRRIVLSVVARAAIPFPTSLNAAAPHPYGMTSVTILHMAQFKNRYEQYDYPCLHFTWLHGIMNIVWNTFRLIDTVI